MRLCPLVDVSAIIFLGCYVTGTPTRVDVDLDDKPEGVTEAVTVTQRTRISRRRRDAVDHVDFPHIMQFRLQFSDRDVDLTLKRNTIMRTDVTIQDENGPIEHDLGRKAGIYQDFGTQSAFVVQCEDFSEHCSLRGSTIIDGKKWALTPDLVTEKLHTAEQINNDADLRFAKVAPTIPGGQEFLSRADDSTRRQKRWVETGPPPCFVVECEAIADETVFEDFKAQTSIDNDTLVIEVLSASLLALYSQADLHYDFVSFRSPDTCIRLYPSVITVQTTRNESWSVPNEIDVAGARIAYVDGEGGLKTCGAQGSVNNASATTIDLVQCFTRKDIVEFNDETGRFSAAERSLAFRETVCVPNRFEFASSVIELYGDKVELLVAHEIALGLGAFEDSKTEDCTEDDSYIMADQQLINPDDLKLINPWYFSRCTLNDIMSFLEQRPNCLLEDTFDQQDFDDFINQPLAGGDIDASVQCALRFGNGSEPCDPTGQDRTFLDDMCGKGMFCTEVEFGDGNCTGRLRPYDGTLCGRDGSFCSKGECIQRSVLGESCACFEDCSTGNSTCSTRNLCVCADGFYDDDGVATIGGSCVPKVAVNEHCPQPDACADPNAMCVGDNCTCNADYYADAGSCFLLISPGQSCTESKECRGDDVECLGSPMTCQCPSDRYFDFSTGNCLTRVGLNERCEPGQCADPNAVCSTLTNTCTCAEGFADNGTSCEIDCPRGNFQRFEDACYLFGTTEFLFNEARTFCDGFDSDVYESNLVQWDSLDEIDFLKSVMNSTTTQPDNGYWNDLFQTGDLNNENFLTTGDIPDPSILDWNDDQPDNRGGELQLCSMFFKQFEYKQADIECEDPNNPGRGTDRRTAFALCKIPLPMLPTMAMMPYR